MAVNYGYLKNTDDATMGSLQRVPTLKEVGVTSTNDHFVVFGTKAEVREWFKAHSSLKVTSSESPSVRVTSRVRKVHKSTMEVIGNKLFDAFVPKAGNASKLAGAVTAFTDAHPWIVHFELYPDRKEPESIDVFSNTPLENVARRLSME
jgi:hypothetical protein